MTISLHRRKIPPYDEVSGGPGEIASGQRRPFHWRGAMSRLAGHAEDVPGPIPAPAHPRHGRRRAAPRRAEGGFLTT